MTHRNRVLPTGEIAAASFRGAWMGNRGGPVSDDPARRQWASRAWLCCRLDFNDRRAVFRQPGRRYTELFFYDEAHALAAGHRPCGECRHHRLQAFKVAAGLRATTPVAELDALLHQQRTGPPDRAAVSTLPDGAFVRLGTEPILLWAGGAFRWTPREGYLPVQPPDAGTLVEVLTPPLTRAAIAAGYEVEVRSGAQMRQA